MQSSNACRKPSISSFVVRWLKDILHDSIARRLSWHTAYTAFDGVPFTEHADFTEMHTPLLSSAC